jgi:hypothetical protein
MKKKIDRIKNRKKERDKSHRKGQTNSLIYQKFIFDNSDLCHKFSHDIFLFR